MYLFLTCTVLLLSFAFIALTDFQDSEENYSLFSQVIVHGVISGMVGVLAIFFACWHHRLIMCTLEEPPVKSRVENRMALPAIMDRLDCCPYEDVLGHGRRLYATECAICLEAWEPVDKIKVTPCKHAFHEECLARWLKDADTCALCRQDVVSAVEEEHINSAV